MAKNDKEKENQAPPQAPVVDEEARAGIAEIKSALGELVSLIKEERKEREDLQEQIQFVADKSRQMMWEEKTNAGKDSPRVYKLATYNGKIVVGWSAMKQNVVLQEQNKTWVEKLTTELFFNDGTKEVVDYKDWQLARIMIEAVWEGEELTNGSRIIKLVTQDGTKLAVDVRFLN